MHQQAARIANSPVSLQSNMARCRGGFILLTVQHCAQSSSRSGILPPTRFLPPCRGSADIIYLAWVSSPSTYVFPSSVFVLALIRLHDRRHPAPHGYFPRLRLCLFPVLLMCIFPDSAAVAASAGQKVPPSKITQKYPYLHYVYPKSVLK